MRIETIMKYLILSLLLLFSTPSLAATDCAPGSLYSNALVSVKANLDAGEVAEVHYMQTMEEVDKFLKFFNETYFKNIPLGTADHAISFLKIKGNNQGLWVFGYKDGCQVGFVYVPTKAEKMKIDGQEEA